MRFCLVEDDAIADLEPLTFTRSAFDLFLGASTIGSKIARAFRVGAGKDRLGMIVRPHLSAVQRERDPRAAVNDFDWLACGPVLVANGRWVPPAGFTPPDFGTPWLGICDGLPACAWVSPDLAAALEWSGIETWFEEVATEVQRIEIGGEWICRPWDIIARNADYLVRDFEEGSQDRFMDSHLSNSALVGPVDRLFIHETAQIHPYTVLDTTNGPITIETGVIVQPFTRIEGPSYIGRNTQLFRANLRGGVTLGPNCRIGGEIEAAVVHGHSNKYHEGFLGHSYVGEWVNLGAITSNSDLRNDYGEVHVPLGGNPVATGQAKVGCFIGDHTRTGLGSMLNTGTALGVMCNVLPAGSLLPKHVPSFSAVLHGRVAPGLPLEQMFATAKVVTGRRGRCFTEVEEQLYRDLFEQTRLDRERAFQTHLQHHNVASSARPRT